MATPQSSRMLVVLAPDLVGSAFTDAACGEVFRWWRDGRITPMVNRALLVRYLKVLRGLGLSEPMVRRWGWWFTAHEKALFLSDATPAGLSGAEMCRELARLGGAQAVIGSAPDPGGEAPGGESRPAIKWVTAEAFVREAALPTGDGSP